jgi:hypothetical protein
LRGASDKEFSGGIDVMRRREFIKKSLTAGVALCVSHNLLDGLAFADNVKVTPWKGKPGHGFTVHDIPMARLITGSIAEFEDAFGDVYQVPLLTHHPYKTAKGSVPSYIPAGTYTVWIVNDYFGGFSVGTFEVVGTDVVLDPPSIEPESGSVGTDFKITDPQGRIQSGDLALFYTQGSDPALGTPAENVSVPGSTTLNGRVPSSLIGGITYYVAVRPTPTSPSRFDDLPFTVS